MRRRYKRPIAHASQGEILAVWIIFLVLSTGLYFFGKNYLPRVIGKEVVYIIIGIDSSYNSKRKIYYYSPRYSYAGVKKK